MTTATAPQPIWTPGPDAADSALARFARAASERTGRDLTAYADLHAWSVEDLPGFWALVWEQVGMPGEPGEVLAEDRMPGARWFPEVSLSYVDRALAGDAGTVVVTEADEAGTLVPTTRGALRAEVAAVAAALRGLGVSRGDRVVGYLPTTRAPLVAFLATASLGAVWSACGQDYGPAAASDRFAQLEPVVLVAGDGYDFGGRRHDRRDAVADLAARLPGLRAVVHVDHLGLGTPAALPDGIVALPWADALATPAGELECEQVPFDHPLWVLYSSGTTGKPKGIVHGHGGVVLTHLKDLSLQMGLGAGDTFCWYTTPNWMMWNLCVGGLLTGAGIVFVDGNPVHPGPDRLWRVVADAGVTVFGTSPGFLLASEKAGLHPGAEHDLSALGVLGVTGSALHTGAWSWVRDEVGGRVQVVSTSGGTDVAAAFVGGAPTVPVWEGEISCAALGVALDAVDAEGRSVRDDVGELVVTRPMPSMPVHFWDDPDGAKQHAAYFDVFPGVWRHGDWITLTSRGTVVVHGRSDSTLNRHGVRLGSADIYEVVEAFEEVRESLVIGAEMPDGGYWMPLFLVLADGAVLDDDLRERIRAALRRDASPRHVPDEITEVPALPHTRTGKKVEVPVKRVLQGADPESALSLGALDDPTLVEQFVRIGAEHRAG